LKRIIGISICLLIGILVLAGCQANEVKPKPESVTEPPGPWTPVASLDDIKYDANTPDNIILEGRRTFQSACSACHDLPTTQRITEFISDEKLIEFMIPMSEESGLPLEHSEKIIRYMLAVLHDSVP
jgi:hypothetical protein